MANDLIVKNRVRAMAMDIDFSEVNALFAALDRELDTKDATAWIRQNAMRMMRAARDEMRAEVADTFIDSRRWTGNLMRSYKGELVSADRRQVRFRIFSRAIYARVQDEGETITPKRAKWLTVPITPEAESKRSAREFGDRLFFFRKGARAYLGERVGGTVRAHYSLRKRVKIPPTRYFQRAIPRIMGRMALISRAEVRQLVERAVDESRRTKPQRQRFDRVGFRL